MSGKVVKPNNGTPDELEKSIGEALKVNQTITEINLACKFFVFFVLFFIF